MKKIITTCFAIFAVGFGTMAAADEGLSKMVGKWTWEKFTVEVKKCPEFEVCATVTGGPKNVGLKMIRSKLTLKGKDYTGKVAHPQTGNIYNTKITMTDADTWKLDGCTDANVCAKGEFKRVK